ncbi:MAG TPA: MBL fold metallo-hydrolase [Nocardioidaceae bacterium]|jgi:glyoxylase-like metal-dependent hydrolase (beta-lactamase superfamily II)|nr:MBL fold metallo-hydrolase [Nocardioidaceae bacterium]
MSQPDPTSIGADDCRYACSWTRGGVTVHRIDETSLPAETGSWLLPDASADLIRETTWLFPQFADPVDGSLRLSSHSFAFELDGRRILVDTGIGNHKPRTNPAWNQLSTDYLKRLTAVGFAPETVDLVILTHLHTDHVGWNTRLLDGDWVPTFPTARYLTTEAEWDFWTGQDLDPPRRQLFADSVYPVRDSGQLDVLPYRDQVEVLPGIRLLAMPGHTPGQVAVELADGALIITGDAIHHPIQIAHPDLTSGVDVDPAMAVSSRRRLLDAAAASSATLLGSHFPPPTAGIPRHRSTGYQLQTTRG